MLTISLVALWAIMIPPVFGYVHRRYHSDYTSAWEGPEPFFYSLVWLGTLVYVLLYKTFRVGRAIGERQLNDKKIIELQDKKQALIIAELEREIAEIEVKQLPSYEHD